MKREVIIIGGGLAGLTGAFKLQKQGLKPLIIESNNRLGGRIYTKSMNGEQFELGATWVFEDPNLKQLIKELGLDIYLQYLKGDALIKYDPSMAIQRSPTDSLMNGALYHKIKGGTGAIIQALADHFSAEDIRLNTKVVGLDYQSESIKLTTADGLIMDANQVIITIPPKMIAERMNITPALDNPHVLQSTHTWMGESSKFTVLLDKDYWRINNLSGFVYSNYGLIREMQDHQTTDGKSFGLLGFIQPTSELVDDFDKRKHAVVQELMELFNIDEENVLAYDDFLWGQYFVDAAHQNYNTHLASHQNNGHALYQISHFGGRLFFAGAETSSNNPGYMEGAVSSAYRAVHLLLNQKV
jgi:monoamine oxidase